MPSGGEDSLELFFGMDGWHPRYSGPLIGPRRRLARITREIEEQMFSSAAEEFESGPDTNFKLVPSQGEK